MIDLKQCPNRGGELKISMALLEAPVMRRVRDRRGQAFHGQLSEADFLVPYFCCGSSAGPQRRGAGDRYPH
jgi:hypothetical protein